MNRGNLYTKMLSLQRKEWCLPIISLPFIVINVLQNANSSGIGVIMDSNGVAITNDRGKVNAFNQFLANVNSSSCSLYDIGRPSVCLSSVCNVGAPYSGD